VTGVRIPGTAHWVAEENPDAFVAALLGFIGARDEVTAAG
jgi:pimeloyl-ACP methyl ester carboxylesterase